MNQLAVALLARMTSLPLALDQYVTDWLDLGLRGIEIMQVRRDDALSEAARLAAGTDLEGLVATRAQSLG